jgi:CubicO group peptidase (beta-lactamase class C family)
MDGREAGRRVSPRTARWAPESARWLTVAALLVMTVQPAAAQKGKASAGPRMSDLDAFVAKTMTDWKVPGVAIAIVKDDSIIYSKGYGTRTVGKTEPVDANTIFAIGSSSKAFTAALIAMAVDEGKMPRATSRSAMRCRTAAGWRAATSCGTRAASRAKRFCVGCGT